MSKKIFYSELKALIQNNAPSILHVALWNNQVDLSFNEQREHPFLSPACFIEFSDLLWSDLSCGKQQAELLFTIRVVIEDYSHDPVEYLEIIDELFIALHQSSTSVSGDIKRRAERQDRPAEYFIGTPGARGWY